MQEEKAVAHLLAGAAFGELALMQVRKPPTPVLVNPASAVSELATPPDMLCH